MVRVCTSNMSFSCIRPCVHCPSICLSRSLLNHYGNSTIFATSHPIMVRVCENILFFWASILRLSVHQAISSETTWRNSTKLCYITSHHDKGVREKHLFPCIRPCIRLRSICPSSYFLINQWVEFNQICYITSHYGKGVREQPYFSVRASGFRPSVCYASPPKPPSGIQPNLLRDLLLW